MNQNVNNSGRFLNMLNNAKRYLFVVYNTCMCNTYDKRHIIQDLLNYATLRAIANGRKFRRFKLRYVVFKDVTVHMIRKLQL